MQKMYKSTIILAVIMFASKLVAFGRDIVLTNCYGASYISDAFLVSISIPTVLFSGVVTALFTCYIPFYKKLKGQSDYEVEKFNGNLISVIWGLSCVLVVLCWIFDEALIKVFAVGFDTITFNLTKEMTHIIVLVMLFMGTTYILQGFLQANESFYLVGAMTIPTNLIIAGAIWASTESTVQCMAWGTVLGYAIYIPYFGIPAYKKGFRFRPCINIHDENLKSLLVMVMPVFLGQIIFEINSVVDKSVASLLPVGGVTALDYSFKVVSMIHSSVVAPISTIIYPKFSGYIVEGKNDVLKSMLNQVLRVVEIIVIPMVGAVIILAQPIIEILFYHGAFTDEAMRLTTESMIAYACCVIPISLRIICEKVFYARQESKIPMLNSAGGILVNIILDIVLVRTLAHVGLALATTISSFVTFGLFLISLYRRIGKFGVKEIVYTGLKSGIATIVMCCVLAILNHLMIDSGNIVRICVSTVVGIIVYIGAMLIFREKIIVGYLKSRRQK